MLTATSAHCRAVSSFVAGLARWAWCGCAAISQASFFAQALHEVVVNGLLAGGEVHEISCGQRQSPRAVAAGLNKVPVPLLGVPGEKKC